MFSKAMSSKGSVALAVLLVAGVSTAPAFAATTIKVVEDGEAIGGMSLKLEPQTVKAGAATFSVKNDATFTEHEMVVVRLKSADQKIPLDTKAHKVNEKELRSLGEVEDLKPGASGTLKATLRPGTYLVFCNYKGHYEAGMASKLTVSR